LPKNRLRADRAAGSARLARETAAALPDLEARAAALLEARRGKSQFRAPPQAGALAARIVKPLIPSGTKTLSELRRQWPEIVGDKLAQLTAPEKLTKGPDGAVVTLTVAGSAAPFVQHQTPLILERLRLAGCAAVAITMKQGALPQKTPPNVRPLTVPLSADAEKALNAALAPIDDDRLRAALLRLGRAVGAPKSR
jgi:hypothetical protein